MNEKFEIEASDSAEKKLESCKFKDVFQMNKIKLGQRVGKEFKFESSRRVSLHLHITVVKLLPKTLIAMRHREFTDFVPKLLKTRIIALPWHFN